MRFPRLTLHAKAFALPGALSYLEPFASDTRRLADMGLVRGADGNVYPAPSDKTGLEPKRAA